MDEFTLTLQKLKGELAEADASFKQACTALQDAYHNKNTYAHAKRDIENKMAKIEELMAFNEMCILTKTYCLSSSLLNEELLAIGQGMDKNRLPTIRQLSALYWLGPFGSWSYRIETIIYRLDIGMRSKGSCLWHHATENRVQFYLSDTPWTSYDVWLI